MNKLPIFSIDNMQVIDRCKLDIQVPLIEKQNYLIAKNIVKAKIPNCNKYIISSFFEVDIRKKTPQWFHLILRNEIIQKHPSHKNPLLVYQATSSENDLINIFQ